MSIIESTPSPVGRAWRYFRRRPVKHQLIVGGVAATLAFSFTATALGFEPAGRSTADATEVTEVPEVTTPEPTRSELRAGAWVDGSCEWISPVGWDGGEVELHYDLEGYPQGGIGHTTIDGADAGRQVSISADRDPGYTITGCSVTIVEAPEVEPVVTEPTEKTHSRREAERIVEESDRRQAERQQADNAVWDDMYNTCKEQSDGNWYECASVANDLVNGEL